MSDDGTTTLRKRDHIRICIEEHVQASNVTTGFENYRLIHNALPELNLADVDTSCEFLGKQLSMPILISAISGGIEEARSLNRLLANAAQEFGIAMSVGSQRIALENAKAADTFNVRDLAPNILLLANIGAVQLNCGVSTDDCRRIVEMIGADALTLHLNPIHECMQNNGDTNFASLLPKIEVLCNSLNVPVIAKEVGFGLSPDCAIRLAEVGIHAVDIAGAGGTSWALVESYRSQTDAGAQLARLFADWGIPTAECVREVRSVLPKLPIIASGGIQTGIEVAKAIALGADIAGIARPMLLAASKSYKELQSCIAHIQRELTVAMFGTGCAAVANLKGSESKVRPVAVAKDV